MKWQEVRIFDHEIFYDSRGLFREWFKFSELQCLTNFEFTAVQANFSMSNYGVIRGLHYSLIKRGQSKVVTCVKGKILDVTIDLRVSSPNFKKVTEIELSESTGHSIYIPHGFAHGFQALEDNTAVAYILDSEFNSDLEKSIDPFDPDLNISWRDIPAILSIKDQNSVSLNQAINNKLLPE